MTLGETSDSLTLPKGQVVEYSVTDQNSHSLIVRANRPIFLTHRAVDASGTVYTDAMSVPPAAKALWGIGSTSVFIGAIEDETVVWARREGGQSGSDMISVELNAGDRYDLSNFVESGVGAALYLAANKPIGAVRTGGSGGLDEGLVSLTPKNLFATRFALPSAAERVVVGCIHDQTQVVLYQPDQSPQIVQCDVEEMTGSVVLQSVAGSTSITPGSYIETTLPVFAAFKSAASNEENNLFGERLLNPAP